MAYIANTEGQNVGMAFSPASGDYALSEVGPVVSDGAGHTSAAPVPAIPTTPVANSATAVAAASCVATLPAVAGKTTYIRGFSITTASPAAVETGVATVTGLLAGTLNFQVVETVAGGAQLLITFADPLPASATNTTIVVTLPAIASGAVSAVSAWGFQR